MKKILKPLGLVSVLLPLVANAEVVIISSGANAGESLTQDIGAVADAGGTCLGVTTENGMSYIVVPEGAPLDPLAAIDAVNAGAGAASCEDAFSTLGVAQSDEGGAAVSPGMIAAGVLGLVVIGAVAGGGTPDEGDGTSQPAAAAPPATGGGGGSKGEKKDKKEKKKDTDDKDGSPSK